MKLLGALAVVQCAAILHTSAAVISFTDISVVTGVGLRSESSLDAIFIDVDSDQDLDLMVWSSGERDDMLYLNVAPSSFEDVSETTGLYGQFGVVGERGGGFYDYNHDSHPDVYVPTLSVPPNINENLFYLNTNGVFFTEIGETIGLRDLVDRIGTAWADVNRDGWLDIYVGAIPRTGFDNRPALYINCEGESFNDEWSARGLTFVGNGQDNLWFDWEEDGDSDLYLGVSVAASPEEQADHLFRNDGTGHFTEVLTALSPSPESTADLQLADFDSDGLLDIFVLHNFADSVVWRDRGDGTFEDIAPQLNLTMPIAQSSNDVHAECVVADFDNDMDQDVFVVLFNPFVGSEPPYQLWLNEGGVYAERGVEAGVDHTDDAIACAAGDINGDGFLDVFVANQTNFKSPDVLFLCDGNSNHWLEIDPVGTISNTDGIGLRAWVTAGGVTQVQELYSRTSLPSLLHFGLASNEVVDEVVLRWPSGLVESYEDLPADQVFRPVEYATVSWAGGAFQWR